jgi:sec-independent protein translocase protein TatC
MSEVRSNKKKGESNPQREMPFWKHVEEFRWALLRIAVVVLSFSVLAFVYKEIVFDLIILGPSKADFITYRILCSISESWGLEGLCIDNLQMSIVNLTLTGQFLRHISISIVSGIILASPYVIWELWRFVKPALKSNEKKYATYAVMVCVFLFLTGVLFSYYVIVPLTVNFLANYSISEVIKNTISLESYVGTVTSLTLIMGLVFELPVVMYLLGKFGIITSGFIRKQRKYAVVIVLIAAAFITPGSDAFSLLLVSLPLYVLFELSLWVMPGKKTEDEIKG